MISVADRLNDVKEYYFSRKLREVRALMAEGKPIINLGIGSPDLKPPKEVTEALKNADVHSYQSYQGIPELRAGIASFYNRHYGVSIDQGKEVLPLMGSKEGILHISMAFLNKGDRVLIPNPGYPTYGSVARLVQAEPVFYALKASNSWLPDLEELRKTDLSRVKIMWVNYPHMPTGSNATLDLFKDLIAFAKENDILLVNDNPYSFVLNNHPISVLAVPGAKDVAIELNSLSKSFNMAGWRVGMLLGHERYLGPVLQVKSNMDSGMFYGIQKGAVEALKLPDHWFDEINEIYKRRRAIVWQICELLNLDYEKDSSGMFVWAKLPDTSLASSEEFADELLYKKNVFITPGTVFGTEGEGYVRFSLCVSIKHLEEVKERIENERSDG